MVPTRELALQTAAVMKKLGKNMHLNIIVTTGGTSLRDDIIRLMKPCHVIIATPGRLLDLCNKQVCLGFCFCFCFLFFVVITLACVSYNRLMKLCHVIIATPGRLLDLCKK
jgi:superfamily II DNA/RNA helicase